MLACPRCQTIPHIEASMTDKTNLTLRCSTDCVHRVGFSKDLTELGEQWNTSVQNSMAAASSQGEKALRKPPVDKMFRGSEVTK